MADTATLNFLAPDGSAVCAMALVVQGKAGGPAALSALDVLPSALARDAGEVEVQLLEGCRYEYELANIASIHSALVLGLANHYSDKQGIVLQSQLQGRPHCGVIVPGLATGQLPLVVRDASGVVLGRASVEVRSRKLNYKADYQQMLTEITEQCVALLQDLRAPSDFHAVPDPGADAHTLGQQFAFLRSLLNNPAFDNALHRITSHPHEQWRHEAHDQLLARGFKPTAKLMRQLATGGRRAAVPPAHPLHATLPSLPERLVVNQASLTLDTPENRFVKFALRGFQQFLLAMGQHPKLDCNKDARLLSEIAALCQRLDKALASDVLRHASEPTFLPLGSPTLQRREGYREVLQAWAHFAMAAKLSWAGGEHVYGAGQRDVATLYEYWVFFALLRVVGQVFELGVEEKTKLFEPTSDGFGLKLKAGKHLALSGQSQQPGRLLEVRFSYNRSFRATTQPRVAGSWTQALRPDYTLSLWPAGFSQDEAELQELMVHVHFDAKYRLEQAADLLAQPNNGDAEQSTEAELDAALEAELNAEKLAERAGNYKRADLLKMHAYRDAIRRSQGAYVIYPGATDDSKRLSGFHEVLPGLGAFALRPGSGTDAITRFLHDVVNHVADRSTAREQSSFHTYKTYEASPPPTASEHVARYLVMPEKQLGAAVRQTPPRETFVVVGWVKDDQHLNWIRTAGKYNFRMGAANGALQLSAQVVGAQYLLLHGADGQAVKGLFRIQNPIAGPRVHTAEELTAMGYPTTPSQRAYLVYDVEPALEFADYGWDYAALPSKPANAANGHPFATDLHTLLVLGGRQR